MKIDDVAKVVVETRDMLPGSVLKCLADVEIVICEDPAHAHREILALFDDDPFEPNEFVIDAHGAKSLPLDTKGVFIGEPMSSEDGEDDDDGMALVEMPEGVIALVASNLTSPEEVHVAFLHEVAHALDYDEDEVAQLGLSAGLEEPHAGKIASNGKPVSGG